MGDERGFSLVEMLVAVLLALVLTAALFALVLHAQFSSARQSEVVDMQQRARVASVTLFNDLVIAGAGIDEGPLAGPLSWYLPPIVPRRLGLQRPDGPIVARPDALTIAFVAGTHAQATLQDPLPAASAPLTVAAWPNCLPGAPLCGLAAGATALVFDSLGHFDFFGVTDVAGSAGSLQLRGEVQSGPYPAGANIAEAQLETYYFDPRASQLRRYDGFSTDVPVIDNVVGLSFAYFGDPRPPVSPKPPAGVENCLYDTAGILKPMPTLNGLGDSLVPLPLSMFTDGPWCGGGTNQFDADLLRVRMVRVTLRVQATSPAFRGAGPEFGKPGTNRSANTYLPDYVVAFDVSPRNLRAPQ